MEDVIIDSKVNEFEREPVPAENTKGARSFWGLFSSEHVAGTELLIGPLFVVHGVSAFDVLVGLIIGNIMAVLSWRFLTVPIALKHRLTLYMQLEKIGGRTGWYYGNFLWQLRGFIDRMIGGIGLKRGRRNYDQIQIGDALDFWRVMEVTPPERLVLLAEMKVPGEALLEIRVRLIESDLVELQLLSRFLPKGLFGMVYWYALFPFHAIVFSGMLRSLARETGKPLIIKPHRFTPVYGKSCDILPMS